MPGSVIGYFEGKDSMKRINHIIKSRDLMFVAEVKGHIHPDYINECLEFPPITMNLDIENTDSMLGTFMFETMKKCGYPINKKDRKLCMLTSTMDQYCGMKTYRLWFLIDYLRLIIDDVKSLILFSKHKSFKPFVTTFMEERKKALGAGDDAKQKFCKLVLNGNTEFESLNFERFTKTRLLNAERTFSAHQYSNFRGTTPITDNLFAVEVDPQVVSPKTPLQSAVFTLDNSKFWMLNFVYRNLKPNLDKDKFMITHHDTDSLYIAVADEETERAISNTKEWGLQKKEVPIVS
jgi:hypothetical protein